jgi:hypothetical protein
MKQYIGGRKVQQGLRRCLCENHGELRDDTDGGWACGFAGDELRYNSREDVIRVGGRHFRCVNHQNDGIYGPEYIILPDGSTFNFHGSWKKCNL